MFSDEELVRILLEDCPYGDITTHGLGIGEVAARMRFAARAAMTLAGVEQAARLLELCGAGVRVHAPSGTSVEAGATILEASAAAASLHRGYKTAQTLLEILGGVASATRAVVQAAREGAPACRVVCTRKHMPGIKRWALLAIEAGGAIPHRLGLSDSVLVFDQHRVLLDAGVSIDTCIERLRARAPERRVSIEAESVEEAIVYARAGADVVQVDKLDPVQVERIAQAFASLQPRPLLAAAGGIDERNAAAYARAGADLLVTSAPYYARPRDVRVEMRRGDA